MARSTITAWHFWNTLQHSSLSSPWAQGSPQKSISGAPYPQHRNLQTLTWSPEGVEGNKRGAENTCMKMAHHIQNRSLTPDCGHKGRFSALLPRFHFSGSGMRPELCMCPQAQVSIQPGTAATSHLLHLLLDLEGEGNTGILASRAMTQTPRCLYWRTAEARCPLNGNYRRPQERKDGKG